MAQQERVGLLLESQAPDSQASALSGIPENMLPSCLPHPHSHIYFSL